MYHQCEAWWSLAWWGWGGLCLLLQCTVAWQRRAQLPQYLQHQADTFLHTHHDKQNIKKKFPQQIRHRKVFYLLVFCQSKNTKYCSGRGKHCQQLLIVLSHFHKRKEAALTLIHADGHYGATELQSFISIRVHSPCGTLNPRTMLEVDWIQSDELGWGEEGIKVNFPHWTGDTIWACWGADKPTVTGQGVVDVLTHTDRTCFVIVWMLGVTGLKKKRKKMLVSEIHAKIILQCWWALKVLITEKSMHICQILSNL